MRAIDKHLTNIFVMFPQRGDRHPPMNGFLCLWQCESPQFWWDYHILLIYAQIGYSWFVVSLKNTNHISYPPWDPIHITKNPHLQRPSQLEEKIKSLVWQEHLVPPSFSITFPLNAASPGAIPPLPKPPGASWPRQGTVVSIPAIKPATCPAAMINGECMVNIWLIYG